MFYSKMSEIKFSILERELFFSPNLEMPDKQPPFSGSLSHHQVALVSLNVVFRYRDTNYVNILSKKEMESDNLRLALLGSIRYGKHLIVDFDQMEMFNALETYLNNIKSDLFDACLSKRGNQLIMIDLDLDI